MGIGAKRPFLRCAQAPTLEAAQEAGLHGRNGPGRKGETVLDGASKGKGAVAID